MEFLFLQLGSFLHLGDYTNAHTHTPAHLPEKNTIKFATSGILKVKKKSNHYLFGQLVQSRDKL